MNRIAVQTQIFFDGAPGGLHPHALRCHTTTSYSSPLLSSPLDRVYPNLTVKAASSSQNITLLGLSSLVFQLSSLTFKCLIIHNYPCNCSILPLILTWLLAFYCLKLFWYDLKVQRSRGSVVLPASFCSQRFHPVDRYHFWLLPW